MRRVLLALAVAALMAVMAASAAAAAPAPDAGPPIGGCPPSFAPSFEGDPSGLVPVEFVLAGTGLTLDSPGVESIDVNNDELTCLKLIAANNPKGLRAVFADNHFPPQQ